MPANILTILQSKMREDMNEIADLMAADGCKSFDEYRKMAGIVEGIARSERHLLDLVEAQEQAEEGD